MPDHPTLAAYSKRFRSFIASTDTAPFGPLALELFKWQVESNPVYRRHAEHLGLPPSLVTRWEDIPALPTAAFKEGEATCLKPEHRTTVFHSSGTSQTRPSRHFHSPQTLAVYEASLWPNFQAHLLNDIGPDYVCLALTPPPQAAPHSSLVHMFATIERNNPGHLFTYAGQLDAEGAWQVDVPRAQSALEQACSRSLPVVLLGPAFAYAQLIESLSPLPLPKGSRAMETGGYKGRTRAWSKTQLREAIHSRLRISPQWVVSEYGMSELSSQAYDRRAGCSEGVFQFPRWARARVISPETQKEVAEGETGLIRVVDLANVSSAVALQTEDLGVRRGSGFEWAGRAAGSEPRGCSLRMSDVLP